MFIMFFQASQLAEYTGDEPVQHNGRLLMGVCGLVYDVTKGVNFYGPGGGYHNLCGVGMSKVHFCLNLLHMFSFFVAMFNSQTRHESWPQWTWHNLYSHIRVIIEPSDTNIVIFYCLTRVGIPPILTSFNWIHWKTGYLVCLINTPLSVNWRKLVQRRKRPWLLQKLLMHCH